MENFGSWAFFRLFSAKKLFHPTINLAEKKIQIILWTVEVDFLQKKNTFIDFSCLGYYWGCYSSDPKPHIVKAFKGSFQAKMRGGSAMTCALARLAFFLCEVSSCTDGAAARGLRKRSLLAFIWLKDCQWTFWVWRVKSLL